MKFNSQICTTREQSVRLLSLGLKRETADMYYSNSIICAKPYYKVVEFMNGCVPEDIFPAWSLHRLIAMIPQELDGIFFSLSFNDAGYSKPGDWVLYERKGAYDSIIGCIEWLIKEGYFSKEYLV